MRCFADVPKLSARVAQTWLCQLSIYFDYQKLIETNPLLVFVANQTAEYRPATSVQTR